MKCPNCKSIIEDNSHTCPECGAILSSTTLKKIYIFVYSSVTISLIFGIIGFFFIGWIELFGLSFALTGMSQGRRILKTNKSILFGFIGCALTSILCLVGTILFLINEVHILG